MKRVIIKTRQARRIILNLALIAFFVWIIASLSQPVSIDHKSVYAEQSPKKSFELVQLNQDENRHEITYYNNESDLRFQSK